MDRRTCLPTQACVNATHFRDQASQMYCSQHTPASVCTRGAPAQKCLSTSQNESVHNGFLTLFRHRVSSSDSASRVRPTCSATADSELGEGLRSSLQCAEGISVHRRATLSIREACARQSSLPVATHNCLGSNCTVPAPALCVEADSTLEMKNLPRLHLSMNRTSLSVCMPRLRQAVMPKIADLLNSATGMPELLLQRRRWRSWKIVAFQV